VISHEIRAAVPTRVGDRFGLHRLLTVQVGDGSGDPEQLKAATGSESALFDDPLPQREPIGLELAVAVQIRCCEETVAAATGISSAHAHSSCLHP
jgi:hypothetical protein